MSLRQNWWLRRVDRVGARVRLRGRPWIVNAGFIALGDDLVFASVPVQSHLSIESCGVLRVGNNVRIGQGAAIACQASIHIGDRTSLGDFCVVADSDFHVPGDPLAAPLKTPIEIGNDVTLGCRVTVLRGATIGDGARVAAGSVVSGAVPAGAFAAGAPARPLSALESNVSERVAEAAREALHLEKRPSADTSREQLARWDSFGAVLFLLALEDAFAVSLPAEEILHARCLRDVADAVTAALTPLAEERRGPRASR